MEIRSVVHRVVAEALRVDEASITDDSSYDNTPEWDSLGMLRIIATLEEETGWDLDPEELAEVLTVGDIVALLVRMQAGDSAP